MTQREGNKMTSHNPCSKSREYRMASRKESYELYSTATQDEDTGEWNIYTDGMVWEYGAQGEVLGSRGWEDCYPRDWMTTEPTERVGTTKCYKAIPRKERRRVGCNLAGH